MDERNYAGNVLFNFFFARRRSVGRKRIYKGDQAEVEKIVMAFLENVA